jgi:polyphosphate kinase
MSPPIPFINRELSWLEFNQRVLNEALDSSGSLLERLKFLAITASNLDEFFMVRVGGLEIVREQGKTGTDPSGLTTEQQLAEISRRTHAMVDDQYRCFLEDIEPRMATAGIRRLERSGLTAPLYEYLEQVFEKEIYPVLSPVSVENAADLPLIPGLGMNLLVRLKRPDDAESRKHRYAVVVLPRKLGRFITLPIEEGHNYIPVEDVTGELVQRLFPGETILEWVPFRITRNADTAVREDLASDLLAEMKEVLYARKQSDCVRLEVSQAISKTSLTFLQGVLKIRDDFTYNVRGPLDLSSYFSMARMAGFDDLRDKPWPPQICAAVKAGESIFETLQRGDLLLYHPYDSFDPVVRLVEEAADDPDVLAIKQILYRTSENSPVVAALSRAASREKHVTAVVELKARFDEARNIGWAESLEQNGVQIIYGIKGLKTHAKICIIVRREAGGIRRYVHFGTGNYNEITARLYSDISFMTCQDDYGADATAFFNMISGYSQPVPFRKIEAAPLGLRPRLLDLIESETQRQQQGQRGHIMVKVNTLVDERIIQALYKASQAGVRIQLNIRGACALRPGVPGISDNITVTSIVDRFLEHARILYFRHGGEPRVFISSADWMPRNLDRRVELLVEVDDPASRERLTQVLETCFRDNVKARQLLADGTYVPVRGAEGEPGIRAQEVFYKLACDTFKNAQKNTPFTFEPRRPSTRL